MSNSSNTASSGGIGVLGALGLLFVGLKLGGVIDWSWWWVTLPFWAGFALLASIAVCAGILFIVAWAADAMTSRRGRR